MTYDFNDAESNTGDLIPKGTVAPVILTIRPGGTGDGGWLTQSRNSPYQYLDCEFTVTAGPFAKRKFWTLLMAGHATPIAAERIEGLPLSEALDRYERQLIAAALTHSDGNVAEAARRLQTDRPNLYRRMRRLGLASAGE
jgi:hypothetical protein